MIGEEKYLDLIAKYLSANIDAAEKEALFSWVEGDEANRSFFEEMIQLWSISNDYEENFDTNIEAAWEKLDAKISSPLQITHTTTTQPESPSVETAQPAKIRRLSVRRFLVRAAAIALLAVSTYWIYNNAFWQGDGTMQVMTSTGEWERVELPDKSVIWLNEDSKITYQRDFNERLVSLEGEAFFEVRKMDGKSFVIHSGDTKTTVLGTSFNVRAYPQEEHVEVTVETGKVRLEENNVEDKRVELEEGYTGVYIKKSQEVEKMKENIVNVSSWRADKLTFNHDPIETVIPLIERYYGIDLDVNDKKILKCEFYFSPIQNPKLNELLEIMEVTMDLKIEEKGGQYIISGKGNDC